MQSIQATTLVVQNPHLPIVYHKKIETHTYTHTRTNSFRACRRNPRFFPANSIYFELYITSSTLCVFFSHGIFLQQDFCSVSQYPPNKKVSFLPFRSSSTPQFQHFSKGPSGGPPEVQGTCAGASVAPLRYDRSCT